MADRSVSAFAVITLLGLIVGGCASDGTMGSSDTSSTSGASGGGAPPTTTKNIDRLASGSVEDTLDNCMARIPKDATAGQKMLAEQSCRRDQADRR